MLLFCRKCNENHLFSPLETEKIIYSMQANLSSEEDLAGLADRIKHLGNNEPDCIRVHLPCLVCQGVLYDHVTSLVASRRKQQGMLYCTECLEDKICCVCAQPNYVEDQP